MPGDDARVLVGTNRVGVRCLEVGKNTVVLEMTAGGERLELHIDQTSDASE
jgi:hypothetical protein